MSYELFDETNQVSITPLLESFWLGVYFSINTGSKVQIRGADFAVFQSVSSETEPRPGRPQPGRSTLRLTDWNANTLLLGPLSYFGQRGFDFGNELGRLGYFTSGFTTANPQAFLNVEGWNPIFGNPEEEFGGKPLLVKKLTFGEKVINRPVFMVDETRVASGATHLRMVLPCLSSPLTAAVLGAHQASLDAMPFQLDIAGGEVWRFPATGSQLSGAVEGCVILVQGAFKGVFATNLDSWLNRNPQAAPLARLDQLMDLVSRAPARPRTLATCSEVASDTVVAGSGDLPVEALVLTGLTGQGAGASLV